MFFLQDQRGREVWLRKVWSCLEVIKSRWADTQQRNSSFCEAHYRFFPLIFCCLNDLLLPRMLPLWRLLFHFRSLAPFFTPSPAFLGLGVGIGVGVGVGATVCWRMCEPWCQRVNELTIWCQIYGWLRRSRHLVAFSLRWLNCCFLHFYDWSVSRVHRAQWGCIICKHTTRWLYLSPMKNDSFCSNKIIFEFSNNAAG